MRYISLFSGIESASVAWQPLGWKAAAFSEVAPFPSAVLAHRYPTVPNLGDVTKISEEQIKQLGRIDLAVFGFPCFVAGTMILSRSGFVPIESLRVGDIVLTHMGRWRAVVSVMRKYGAKLRKIRGTGITDTITTDEHPYYARACGRQWDNKARRYIRTFSNPAWVEAEKLVSSGRHFAGQVLPDVEDDNKTAEWWWLVGRYLADGWRVDRKGRANGRVVICCNHKESDFLGERIKAAGFNATKVVERTTTKFHITRGDFYSFLSPFGRMAHGKTVPGFALCLDIEKSKAMLDGWLSGGGWRNAGQGQWNCATTSEALSLGMALVSQRVYGVVASVHNTKKPPTCVIEGRACNQRDQYEVRIPDKNRSSFVDGRYGWKLIRSSEPCGTGDVFNISVAEDESYIANGAIVHNCQDLSSAGKRAGLVDSAGNKTRSGLFYDAARISSWARARWVVAENVPGLLTSKGGGDYAAVLAELTGLYVPVPRGGWKNFGIVRTNIPGRYSVCWRVLDAQYVGGCEVHGGRPVPQRRRRVFIVGYLGDWTNPVQVLFEPGGLRGCAKKGRGKKTSAGALSASGVGTCGADDSQAQAGHLIPFMFDPYNNATSAISPSLGTNCGMSTGRNIIVHRGVRRLTPREAERLQRIPDDWTLIPWRGKIAKDCPDSPRYKAVGNSMAVNCMSFIGRKIKAVEAIRKGT